MKTAMFWVTFAKDLEWFKYSAKSFRKFGSGWDFARVLVPTQDHELFEGVCKEHNIDLLTADEWPGKGFNWHQYQQLRADTWIPEADIIFHLDADTVFKQPVNPGMWMHEEFPIIGYRRFANMDCSWGPGMWKERVDKAVGGDAKFSTMVSPPYVHHHRTYAATRREIEMYQQVWFCGDYIKGCQNEFPQGFCEFETLGEVAHRCCHNLYSWRDLSLMPHPSEGLVAEGWSHGGLDKVTDRFDGKKTAREVFTDLGL